jgi:hypothetical protein
MSKIYISKPTTAPRGRHEKSVQDGIGCGFTSPMSTETYTQGANTGESEKSQFLVEACHSHSGWV